MTTFGTAFLGLTFECSRCHDHKYDPIKQKDFYSLFAFFQNIDESGQTSYFTDATAVPTLLLSTAEQDAKLAELAKKIAAKEAEYPKLREAAKPAFEKWKSGDWFRPTAPEVAVYSFGQAEKGQLVNGIDSKRPGRVHESPTFTNPRSLMAWLLN